MGLLDTAPKSLKIDSGSLQQTPSSGSGWPLLSSFMGLSGSVCSPPKNIAFVSVSPPSSQSWQWFWHDLTSVTLRLPTDKQLIYRETLRQVCDQHTVVIAVGVALRTQLYSHKTMNGLRQRFYFNYNERQRNLKKKTEAVPKRVANHTTVCLCLSIIFSQVAKGRIFTCYLR